MGENYFNKIPWREARLQLGHCRSMAKEEFADGVNALKGKKNCNCRMWCSGFEPGYVSSRFRT